MKKGLCVIFSVILSISLSGCWSRREPKTLALTNSSIYDLCDEGYKITVEVINPAALGGPQESGSGKNPNITVTSTGVSIPEAIRNASESLERTIFAGHHKVRFFTEKFAEDNMVFLMDYLLRDHLTDESPLVVVIRHDKPELIYSSMLGLSETVGDYITSISKTQPSLSSTSVFVKNIDFIRDYYDHGKQPVSGLVDIIECEFKPSNNTITNYGGANQSSDSNYRIVYRGLAAFKDESLVGYMDEIETRSYNLITNNVKNALVSFPSEDGQTVVIVTRSRADIKVKVEGDTAVIDVGLNTDLSLIQQSGISDISESGPLKRAEATFNQHLTDNITAAIEKAQKEFESDIFGFGQAMHRQHPKKWREIKENWDDYFAKAAVNVSVKSAINRSGEIKQPFRLEAEE